jgi:hypothetical protein
VVASAQEICTEATTSDDLTRKNRSTAVASLSAAMLEICSCTRTRRPAERGGVFATDGFAVALLIAVAV